MRARATDALELAGGLLIIAAAAVWAWSVAVPLALAVAGAGMVAFSWLLTNPAAAARALTGLGARVRRLPAALAAWRAARRRRRLVVVAPDATEVAA